MANYTVTEVMDMLMDDVDDSGEESEIEEDPSFPLPHTDSSSEDSDTDHTGKICCKHKSNSRQTCIKTCNYKMH
jgi:hypothetical protein